MDDKTKIPYQIEGVQSEIDGKTLLHISAIELINHHDIIINSICELVKIAEELKINKDNNEAYEGIFSCCHSIDISLGNISVNIDGMIRLSRQLGSIDSDLEKILMDSIEQKRKEIDDALDITKKKKVKKDKDQ